MTSSVPGRVTRAGRWRRGRGKLRDFVLARRLRAALSHVCRLRRGAVTLPQGGCRASLRGPPGTLGGLSGCRAALRVRPAPLFPPGTAAGKRAGPARGGGQPGGAVRRRGGQPGGGGGRGGGSAGGGGRGRA